MPREPEASPGYGRAPLQAFLGDVLLNGPVARKGHCAADRGEGGLASSYMAAIREMLDGEPGVPSELTASRVLGAEGGWRASCAMAAREYLVERPPDLASMGPPKG